MYAVVAAADAVDLFDEPAVLLDQPRVERIALVEALEVGHRHARVEIVGARLQDVLAGARRLAGDDRIDVQVEEVRLQRASRPPAKRAPFRSAMRAACMNASGVHLSTNLRAVRLL